MFAIIHMDDVVRIPPSMMKKSLNETTMEILKEKYCTTFTKHDISKSKLNG